MIFLIVHAIDLLYCMIWVNLCHQRHLWQKIFVLILATCPPKQMPLSGRRVRGYLTVVQNKKALLK
jgi:hypothetical protein